MAFEEVRSQAWEKASMKALPRRKGHADSTPAWSDPQKPQ